MSYKVMIKAFGKPAYPVLEPCASKPVISQDEANAFADEYIKAASEPLEAIITEVPDHGA